MSNILPSNLQIGESCKVSFIKDEFSTSIAAVQFTAGKVYYDIKVEVGDGFATTIDCVDSAFVIRNPQSSNHEL